MAVTIEDAKVEVERRRVAAVMYQKACRKDPVGRRVLLFEDDQSSLVMGLVNTSETRRGTTLYAPAYAYDWAGEWVKVEGPDSLEYHKVADLTFASQPPV